MSVVMPKLRLETFARLREAHLGDIHALWSLSTRLPGGVGGEHPIWQTLVRAEDAHVQIATECQIVVGAIVLWHHKGMDLARLTWLGVAGSTRRRGIGRLLVESAISLADLGGAAEVVARVPETAGDVQILLGRSGFAEAKGGEFRLKVGA